MSDLTYSRTSRAPVIPRSEATRNLPPAPDESRSLVGLGMTRKRLDWPLN